MKIVYCISGMFKSGGIERVITNKVNYLVAHGYEACIITDDEDGFLEPLYDEVTFAEHLSTLIRDEALRTRMSKAAEVASHCCDLEVIMPQWLTLFNTLNASAR